MKANYNALYENIEQYVMTIGNIGNCDAFHAFDLVSNDIITINISATYNIVHLSDFKDSVLI